MKIKAWLKYIVSPPMRLYSLMALLFITSLILRGNYIGAIFVLWFVGEAAHIGRTEFHRGTQLGRSALISAILKHPSTRNVHSNTTEKETN